MKLKNSTKELFRESDLTFTSEEKLGVQRDYYGVRANQPAVIQTRCKWIIGDVTEVLDHSTWKLGKIAKMLKNNYFVIRLADCIQLKEFHISSLRVPEAPHSNHVPAAEKKPVAMNLKHKLAQRGQMPSNALLTRSNKKRKPTANTSHHPRKRSQPQNAFKSCVPSGMANYFQYRSPQSITEETEECSVASCSINDPELHSANAKQQHQPVGCFFPDDAMSACQCTSSGMFAGEPAAAVGVHELELEAYQSTMRALYASGPLTWEQESLLTNLRLSLNISNEEHLLQLRHLLSSSSVRIVSVESYGAARHRRAAGVRSAAGRGRADARHAGAESRAGAAGPVDTFAAEAGDPDRAAQPGRPAAAARGGPTQGAARGRPAAAAGRRAASLHMSVPRVVSDK